MSNSADPISFEQVKRDGEAIVRAARLFVIAVENGMLPARWLNAENVKGREASREAKDALARFGHREETND